MRTTPLLVLAGAAGVVAATAVAAAGKGAASGEVGIFRAVNDLPDALEVLLWPPMQLGSRAGPLAAALVAAVALRKVAPPVRLLAGGFAAHTAAEWLKAVVERPRPSLLVDAVHVRDSTVPTSWGFPSSHAATAFALAVVASALVPRRGQPAVWGLAAAVAVARLYVGAHLPLDVVGGAAIGVAAGVAARVPWRDPAGLPS